MDERSEIYQQMEAPQGPSPWDIAEIFQSYRQAHDYYKFPGIGGSFLRLVMPSKEEQARKTMDDQAGKLRDSLKPGMLVKLVPYDGRPPLEVVIGRRKGEFTVGELDGVSIYKNKGEEGQFVPMDAFHSVAQFARIEVVKACHEPRTTIYERE